MDSIYKYITQLANSQRRFIDNLAVGKEYSGAQGKVIHYLFTHKDSVVHQKDIEKDFGMRAPTATELLKTLMKKELIQKIPSKKRRPVKRNRTHRACRKIQGRYLPGHRNAGIQTHRKYQPG